MEYFVVSTADELAGSAAKLITNEAESSRSLLLGLAGGSTPKATYEFLAEADIDWTGVTTWMTDERWVSPDHAESNQAMIRDVLGTSGRIRFLAPNTQLQYPEAAAARMTRAMRCLMNRAPGRSVTLLGLGTDGHTASLFPHTDGLDVSEAAYIANWIPQWETWRLTASYGLLSQSDVVAFVVSGHAKAHIVGDIARGVDHPAGRVQARERVIWLLDQDAASEL